MARLLTCFKAFGTKLGAAPKSESYADTGRAMAAYPHEDAAAMGREKSEESFMEWRKYWQDVKNDKNAGIVEFTPEASGALDSNKGGTDCKSEDNAKDGNIRKSDRRWIFAMRHGERVDLTYGEWVPYCFDDKGAYVRKDLNMPLALAARSGGAQSYALDTPLTRVGQLQARLVGEGLRLAGLSVRTVMASAALRCVETAHYMIQGLEADPSVKVKVEPGLFEYKQWYAAKGIAPFMTPAELHAAGYNVDLHYKPYVEVNTTATETLEEFYARNELVMQSAYKDTAPEGGNIMFVGHAATLDLAAIAMPRLATDPENKFPHPYEISKNLLRVPYCALAALRDNPMQLVPPPCPPSSNSSSGRFDWKILLDL